MALARTGFKRRTYERPKPAAPVPIRQLGPCKERPLVGIPKEPRYVDRHLLDMARGQPCLLQSPLCNHNPETTVACHGSGVANGKGMGYKVGDHLTVHGCSDCNHFTDAYGGATAAEKQAVFDAGHKRQVQLWTDLARNVFASPRDQDSARDALEQIDRMKT